MDDNKKQIESVDPYLPHYIYEKANNPETKLYWKAYAKDVVLTIDKIVEMARGERDVVKSQKDWEIVGELLKFYAYKWKDEFEEFKKTIPDIRSSRRADGKSDSGEIMYVGALPQRFIRLIRAIFPFQQFDKKFIWKLVRKFPLFKVAGENNLSKGTVVL